MKRFICFLNTFLLCTVFLLALLPQEQGYHIAEGNRINFGQLLSDLLDAYENPTAIQMERVIFDLETIKAVSSKDYAVAQAVADHWKQVYVDSGYHLNLYQGNGRAPELRKAGIPMNSLHAFIVLGYELQNGEMTEELKGRCEAAAAAAREFPDSILVCSGGATGSNNPERHTEAGMMKAYLTGHCGIDKERILIDDKAMTTIENAVNTFAILKSRNVQSITIVTSSYHQRWGQVLYNAMAAVDGQKYGYSPEILSNYCFHTEPENDAFRNDAKIAVSQLGSLLGIPRQAMRLNH